MTPLQNWRLQDRNRPQDIKDILGTAAFEGYVQTPIQTLDGIYINQLKWFLPLAKEAKQLAEEIHIEKQAEQWAGIPHEKLLKQSFLDQLNSLQILEQLAPLQLAKEHLPSDIIDILERLRKADNIPFNQLYYIAENCADRYYSKVIQAFVSIINRQFADRQTLLVNTAHSLKFLEDYTNRQAQIWKILHKYHNLPDEVAGLHLLFDSFKSSIETDFKHLKEVTSQNVQNIQTSLGVQQTYSSTLCCHFNNIYNKLSELQKHIQHHYMYSHQSDTVQIDAPEYDPDIDGDNQSNTDEKHETVSVQETLEMIPEPSEPEDDNSIAPQNNTVQQNQQETDWPDAPTIQIPGVSSTTDQPLEGTYNRHQVQPSTVDPEIPVLEDDSDRDQFADLDTYMTHHNTHHIGEQIRQEYSATLQNLSDDEYYAEIDRAEFRNYTPASQYDQPACCQEAPRPSQADAPRRSTEELKRIFGKGRGQARWEELHSHRPLGHKTCSLESHTMQDQEKSMPVGKVYITSLIFYYYINIISVSHHARSI